jgi:hypothetical protein
MQKTGNQSTAIIGMKIMKIITEITQQATRLPLLEGSLSIMPMPQLFGFKALKWSASFPAYSRQYQQNS